MFKRSKSRTMELIPRDFPALSGGFRYSYAMQPQYAYQSYTHSLPMQSAKNKNGFFARKFKLKADKPASNNRFKLSAWVVVAIIIFAVVIYPFLPLIAYHLNPFSGGLGQGTSQSGFVPGEGSLFPELEEDVERSESNGNSGVVQAHRPQENTLYIPKIGVQIEIIDHPDEEYGLDNGAWRFPQTSTPDKGGNTALGAHRFMYSPPVSETFYLLDRLENGDGFAIVWEGKEYHYRVNSSKVVSPYDVHVLEDQGKDMVTLITCEPLFSTKERLVVTGELVAITE